MTLLQEFKIFIKSIISWIYALVAFALFFSFFGLNRVAIYGRDLILPTLSKDSLSIQAFKMMERDLVPPGVQLIVTDPWSGFVVQLEITFILAFIASFPFLLYKIIRYISPALFEHEKKAVFRSVVAFTFLFLMGCVFAYYILIPLTFKFMYPFASSLGVATLFSLDSFMAWIIAILITTGIIFLLTIFMTVLSYLGLVSPGFWRRKWKFALFFLLIFSAVITPDGTGITMIMLFVPLSLLYGTGSLMSGPPGRRAGQG